MFSLRWDLGLFPSQSSPKSMFYLFLTDATIPPLLLPSEQNLDPSSRCRVLLASWAGLSPHALGNVFT